MFCLKKAYKQHIVQEFARHSVTQLDESEDCMCWRMNEIRHSVIQQWDYAMSAIAAGQELQIHQRIQQLKLDVLAHNFLVTKFNLSVGLSACDGLNCARRKQINVRIELGFGSSPSKLCHS
jgi:hypothetical protein